MKDAWPQPDKEPKRIRLNIGAQQLAFVATANVWLLAAIIGKFFHTSENILDASFLWWLLNRHPEAGAELPLPKLLWLAGLSSRAWIVLSKFSRQGRGHENGRVSWKVLEIGIFCRCRMCLIAMASACSPMVRVWQGQLPGFQCENTPSVDRT